MQFAHLHYLWVLLIIPFLVVLSVQTYLQSNKWIYLFARKRRPFVPQLLEIFLLCCILGAAAFSLAEPRIQHSKTHPSRAAIELVVGIDVSKSMLAEDISLPNGRRSLFQVKNRLNRSRLFVLNTLAELHGEKIALYIFASGGVEIVSFTRDYGYCNYIVKHINDANITVPGSDLGAAIQTGMTALETSEGAGGKAMVLISDGEDISLDKSSLYESARQAANRGIRIYTVGVGSGKVALIPIRSEDGTNISGYYRDENGSLLKTKLVRETLMNVARITGGNYFEPDLGDTPKNMVEAILKDSEISGEIRSDERTWLELSPFFLMAALVFAVIERFAVGYYQTVLS
jgi:Ca-activated chloride channel family protein